MKSTVLEDLKRQTPEMLSAIETIVNLDSPSQEPALVNRVSEYLADQFQKAGARVEFIEKPGVGKHLKATLGAQDAKPILLVGHMDTVWAAGETKKRPFRIEGGRACGPGVEDMKAGLIQGLFALRYLRDNRLTPKRPLVFFYNSDEEIQSRTSRPVIEELAAGSEAALILEPASHGDLVVARKASGRFFLKTTGRSSHAGSAHHLGINAICEMARHILEFESLTDYSKGTTVNVGTISGGTKANVVPAEAVIEMSCRVTSYEEQDRIVKAILGARPALKDAKVEAWGTFERPLFTCSPGVQGLFDRAKRLADEMGLPPFGQTLTGGASDGNFTAGMGVPTLDGLGGSGDGSHALHEYIEVSAIPERTALLVGLLMEI